MTWNNRIIQHEDYFGLHEVHYDADGKVKFWTSEPVTFATDLDNGADDLIGSLERALSDVRKHPVLLAKDLPQ